MSRPACAGRRGWCTAPPNASRPKDSGAWWVPRGGGACVEDAPELLLCRGWGDRTSADPLDLRGQRAAVPAAAQVVVDVSGIDATRASDAVTRDRAVCEQLPHGALRQGEIGGSGLGVKKPW